MTKDVTVPNPQQISVWLGNLTMKCNLGIRVSRRKGRRAVNVLLVVKICFRKSWSQTDVGVLDGSHAALKNR